MTTKRSRSSTCRFKPAGQAAEARIPDPPRPAGSLPLRDDAQPRRGQNPESTSGPSAPRLGFNRSVHRYGLLLVEQGALQLGTPAIAGDRAFATDDTMTRNAEGNGIRRACARHCTNRVWLADAPRKRRIGDSRPTRDREKSVPNA